VVNRPTKGVGRGYSLTGHHEIMIPLLAAILIESDGRSPRPGSRFPKRKVRARSK
jgi:hypothetical protein